METKGEHIIADVWLEEYPENIKDLQANISEALTDYLTVIDFKLHEFNDYAFTAIWLLSESHFSIHTYPERNYVSIDLYTCGERPDTALKIVGDILGLFVVKEAKVKVLSRG